MTSKVSMGYMVRIIQCDKMNPCHRRQIDAERSAAKCEMGVSEHTAKTQHSARPGAASEKHGHTSEPETDRPPSRKVDHWHPHCQLRGAAATRISSVDRTNLQATACGDKQ